MNFSGTGLVSFALIVPEAARVADCGPRHDNTDLMAGKKDKEREDRIENEIIVDAHWETDGLAVPLPSLNRARMPTRPPEKRWKIGCIG
jgi:hypothetical protein